MNIKEKINSLKRKQTRQRNNMSLKHGNQLLDLYDTCDHKFTNWYSYTSAEKISIKEKRYCLICDYMEYRLKDE